MFTGLIEDVGTVERVVRRDAGHRVTFRTSLAAELCLGDSLAVNGVCLTVVQQSAGIIGADLSPETVAVSTLGALEPGSLVNLERPLRLDSRLGGHFVQGHVDAVGLLQTVRPEADFRRLTIRFPDVLATYLIPKGSIAVDGISLTVARLDGDSFDVQIVPFTWEHTNLRRALPETPVNLECDMIGKYVVRAAELAVRIGAIPGQDAAAEGGRRGRETRE